VFYVFFFFKNKTKQKPELVPFKKNQEIFHVSLEATATDKSLLDGSTSALASPESLLITFSYIRAHFTHFSGHPLSKFVALP
jgi:hypothetical protein